MFPRRVRKAGGMSTSVTFEPFIQFTADVKKSSDFVQLSKLYYGLSTQLALNTPPEQLENVILPPPRREKFSYPMGNIEAQSVEEIGVWLTFAEYAGKTGSSLEEVAAEASNGVLGKVEKLPKSGENVILWPPSLREGDPAVWPKPGLRRFSVEVAILAEAEIGIDAADLQNFEHNQKSLLKLASEIGEPIKAAEQAEIMLLTSVFVNLWVSFETFLKSTIFELLKKHPRKLASTSYGRRASVTYEDVITYTREFLSVDALQEELIRREIERSESGNMSASGMINYLKNEFEFESSPYDAWYHFRGRRFNVQYQDLIEIKEVRNCLMHDGGRLITDLSDRYPHVPVKDGFVAINTDYYTRTRLILSSVAFKVSRTIETGKYRVRD
jgi:hypothetical protein